VLRPIDLELGLPLSPRHFAALHPQPRRDKGHKKALDLPPPPRCCNCAANIRSSRWWRWSRNSCAKAFCKKALSVSTLQRRLAEAGLDRKSLKAGAAIVGGPTKAFELPLPNLLWMADCMHGPVLKLNEGSTQPTFLFALLDDCSRLCVHAQFYAHERLECFLDTLRQALKSRGVPDKLYTDNGAAFRSQHLSIVCANLGIKLLHAKPYAAWSETRTLFLTLQTQFLSALAFEPVHDLATLNTLWRWIEAISSTPAFQPQRTKPCPTLCQLQ
jgi:transposase InsO family protein